jgi:hypothetical protein
MAETPKIECVYFVFRESDYDRWISLKDVCVLFGVSSSKLFVSTLKRKDCSKRIEVVIHIQSDLMPLNPISVDPCLERSRAWKIGAMKLFREKLSLLFLNRDQDSFLIARGIGDWSDQRNSDFAISCTLDRIPPLDRGRIRNYTSLCHGSSPLTNQTLLHDPSWARSRVSRHSSVFIA